MIGAATSSRGLSKQWRTSLPRQQQRKAATPASKLQPCAVKLSTDPALLPQHPNAPAMPTDDYQQLAPRAARALLPALPYFKAFGDAMQRVWCVALPGAVCL
jgi:hypothetical protein